MSPTKRPSAVEGLRRGVHQVRSDDSIGRPEDIGSKAGSKTEARPVRPARVTLNLPPALMREVERWALGAAETLMLPRVSTQDAMRAMLRACTADDEASGAALAQLRQDQD
jgi:hypothetical protein